MAAIAHPAAAIAQKATAENILFVIWLRLLQMARSIQASCFLGYAHEQQGLVRSMVSAASDVMFIAKQDKPANWAMLYATFSIERRKKIGRGYVSIGLWSQEIFDKWDAEQDVKEQKAFEEAKSKGIVPAPKFNQNMKRPPQTWSGLTDADMINKTGRGWYAAYYVPFSDLAHASIMTAEEELKQLKAGEVSVGPRFPAGALAYVITGIAETMAVGAETIDKHFQLDRAKDIAAHDRAMLQSLKAYRDTLPQVPLFED